MIASMTLGLADYAIIFTGLAAIAAVGGYILKGMNHRVDKIEDRVLHTEERKVSQKDWVRVVASQENRMNKIMTQLAALHGKLDATIGLGASISQLSGAISEAARGRT